MSSRFFLLVLLGLLVINPWTLAQDPPEDTETTSVGSIADPETPEKAKQLFLEAYDAQIKEKFGDAVARYNAVLNFYRKQTGTEYKVLSISILNNLGIILSGDGNYQEGSRVLQEALRYAIQLDLDSEVSELYHKLGILHGHLAALKAQRKVNANDVYPNPNDIRPLPKKIFNAGVFTRVEQTESGFIAQKIRVKGPSNPFAEVNDTYSKLVNLKLRSDFQDESLVIPDSVQFLVQVNKRGYYPLIKRKELLSDLEYSEIDETMVAIPRKVEAQITEDFYRQGFVTPDDVTLAPLNDNEVKGKPVKVDDKETFKPGHYRLNIQKSGYTSVDENVTVHPDEGSFVLQRELFSKMREVASTIRGDFNAGETDVIDPDVLTLNGQAVRSDTKIKPGKYDLVIEEEGYEPIIKTEMVEPSERSFNINEYMKALPRQILFQITGDYREDQSLTPDEITLNGRYVKVTGENVRPDNYRLMIRKKGYEPFSDRILVAPKNEPYLVTKKLESLPRRVQPNIFASFPSRLRIFPDTCTLDGKDVAAVENFKPGRYTLMIKHPGYNPVTTDVEIEPSDEPFVINQIIDPKDVELDFEVTFDVDPENPKIPYSITMVNEKTRESVKVKSGDFIQPESYMLTIERPGYETYVQRLVISPREGRYTFKRKLMASLRGVLTQITAEYPEGETVVPDEITLNNQAINKDFKVKPGIHDLVILKEGYLPIRSSVKILASEKDYILSRRLETKTRLVTFEFLDSYDRRKLNPDEVFLGVEQIPAASTVNVKPGSYSLRARKKGYSSVDDNIVVPVSSEPYVVTKFMVAIKRDIMIEITTDFKPEEKISPDILSLNDMPVVDKASIKPGMYNLVIEMGGYFPVLERLDIPPDPKPYIIKRRLVSKPRKLAIVITTAFSGDPITPSSIVLGTQNVKDGQLVKPGEYAVLIKETGYKSVSESIVIKPSENPYNMVYSMESIVRMVQYRLVSDFDNQEVTPDLITMNEKILDKNSSFVPGKYTVKVQKRGYHDKQFEIVMEPSAEPYVITGVLESIAREIEASITGDFPVGEPIDPEVVALSGKDVRDNIFKPGKYELVIQQPGYTSLSKQIVISPGEEPFLLEEELATKPRLVKESIFYDVSPPEGLPPYTITMAPLEDPTNQKTVKDGDFLKPNSYILRIKREAYEAIELTKHVWPDEAPFSIDEGLSAKQVEIHLNITHDVEPPATLDEYKVSLIDQVTKVLNLVTHGKKIKPGNYELDIQRPGYNFGTQKTIEIIPSEQPYQIREKLIAKPRNLSFDMVWQGNLIPAHEVVDQKTGKSISFKDTFDPGSELELKIKFMQYETVVKRNRIVPGEGPQLINVQLIKLKRYEFTSRKNEVTLDGAAYPFILYADSEEIEGHLVKTEKGFGRFYYTIWVKPEAKNLKLYGGYLYSQVAFDRLRLGPGRMENIDVPKLIGHLDTVAKKDNRGPRASMEVMETMLKAFSGKRRLKQAHATELDRLIQFVESWKLPSAQDRIRLQLILEELGKLK